MRAYEKIDTVFCRSTEGKKKLLYGEFRDETIEYLKDIEWIFTEKIDGTNIRVHWDGYQVKLAGREDKSEIPAPLYYVLEDLFLTEEAEEVFEEVFGLKEVTLFGEGYGGNIQKAGPYYSEDFKFILFDVLIGDNYQNRDWVERTAAMFDVDVVPIVCRGTIQDGIDFVMTNPPSTIGTAMMEGVVGRPALELRDRRGHRIITKIKWNDFKKFANRIEGFADQGGLASVTP